MKTHLNDIKLLKFSIDSIKWLFTLLRLLEMVKINDWDCDQDRNQESL